MALDSDFLRAKLSSAIYVEIEPRGLFGIPDLLFAASLNESEQHILSSAFEMKLADWKRALVQAFRYRAFADLSYVMLDHARVRPALSKLDMFKDANIGLLSIDMDGEVTIHYEPSPEPPYSEQLHGSLLSSIFEENVFPRSCA